MKHFFLCALIAATLSSFGNVRSAFTCSATSGCSPLVIHLTDASTGGVTTRYWELGNGNVSNQTNPSATYYAAGTYTIRLVVSDGISTDSSTQMVTVFRLPVVDFISDRSTACPGDTVRFINHVVAGSSPIAQYAWGFGNGIASSLTNVAYTYPASGTYNVTLVVQDTNGCIGNLTKTAMITIWPKPVAAYTVTPRTSCGVSQLVNFTNQSQGSGLTDLWTFGDTAHCTQTSPSHTYQYGSYTAKLLVTNSDGCIDSAKKDIKVINVQARFSASQTLVCAGTAIFFTNLSPTPGNIWHWNFGDGTSSVLQNPIKSYANPGVYSVSFVVRDSMCSDSTVMVNYITIIQGFSVSISANAQNSCTTPFVVNFTGTAPGGASYLWNFGDGNSSDSLNPTNTYTSSSTFSVTLTVTDSSGCTVIASAPAFIKTAKPAVRFTSDTLFCLNSPVRFANRTLNAIRYHWNFGDRDTSSLVNPVHYYQSFGRFTVSLTAWDSIGCDSTLTMPGLIHVDSTSVDFAVNETFSLCPPLVSIFRSRANRNDVSYFWDFGDGYTDTTANPTHIYFHPGIYSVRLIGTTPQGCNDSVTYDSLIQVQGPTGSFSRTPGTGCLPVAVVFSGTVSANTKSFICDLGNGTIYNDSLNFSYTYTAARTFYPTFILTDHVGCTVPYYLDSVTTHSLPVLHVSDTAICAGQQVSVSLGHDSYQWNSVPPACDSCTKRASGCDTCGTFILAPADSTIYMVTANSGDGCTVIDTFSVSIDKMPVLVDQDTLRVCKNQSISLSLVRKAHRVDWTPAMYLDSTTAKNPVCTPQTSVSYKVTAYNRLGCSISKSVPVSVYDGVPVVLTKDTSVCPGSSVGLEISCTDTSFHGVSFVWLPTAGLNDTVPGMPVAMVQNETETFRVLVLGGNCAADTASVTVSVSPAANIELPPTIMTAPDVEVSIQPLSGNLVSYLWTARDTLSCTDCPAPVLVPHESQWVSVTGPNQYGCIISDSMFIHVLNCDPSTIFVANTFTPNGDGVNDKLYVHSKTLAQLDFFRIYNRWGAIVYETNQMSEGWDGMINGAVAEKGVYVYQVSGKCHNGYEVATSGTVTLLR